MRGWPVADERDARGDDPSIEALPRPIPSLLAPPLLSFLFAAALVTLHVHAFDPLSPFDEGVHFDYVAAASDGGIIRKGDVLGPEAMRATACRGIDTPGLTTPPCEGPYEPADFPVSGYNYADSHPPPYYFITAGGAALLRAAGVGDFLTASRLTGVLWLGLGILLTWSIGRELQVPRTRMMLAAALMALSPPALHASSTVNNDATALPMGAAVILVLLRWERGRAPLWLLGAVTFAAPMLKSTNAVVTGAVLLYILVRYLTQDEPDIRRRYLLGAGTALAATAVAVFAWSAIHGVLARPVTNPLDDLFAARGLSLEVHVLPNVSAFLAILHTEHITLFDERAIQGVLFLVNGLVIAAALQHLLAGEVRTRRGALASAGGLAMLTGGTVVLLVNFFLLGFIFDVQPRYGLSLLPLLFVALASAMRFRFAVWFFALVTVVMLALVSATMIRTL